MALNAIKAPLVRCGCGLYRQYITTTIARQQTISDQLLSNSDKYTIKFGEKHLPKLELRRETDDFGRPAYTWAYDKKEIGNYRPSPARTMTARTARLIWISSRWMQPVKIPPRTPTTSRTPLLKTRPAMSTALLSPWRTRSLMSLP